MPKQVKIHPNERVDIPDFERAANSYTAERVAFEVERLLIDRRSRVVEGFRIKIEDQSATPGAITVYNGTALDRDGQSIHDEDQADTSVTLTLSGATTTFFVEVEFAEAETDTDARSFWDPTFDNGGAPNPDGAEFSLSVATRKTPTWRIVQPVSTTGFEATTNPNSVRVPLATLSTNGSNVIDAASTPGLAQVDAASVTEEPALAAATSIRVFNSRLLGNAGDSVVLGFGLASAETVTLTANDKDNGIISFAPTTNAHAAGEIVQATGVGRFMQEKQDPNDPAAHPNDARRLYQGDEIRGGALTQSKDALADRDDMNIRSLKDKLDMHDALMRELKFGAFDPGVTSVAPPTSYTSRPRYFHPVGSVAGARGATLSIGNGTTTFGDFNGTTEAVINAAVAALPAEGGHIYVRAGTYAINNQISFSTVDKHITFVAEYGTVTFEQRDAANAAFLFSDTLSSTRIGFHGIIFTVAGTGIESIFNAEGVYWEMSDCQINGSVVCTDAAAGAVRLTWQDVEINANAGNVAFDSSAKTTGVQGFVKRCTFNAGDDSTTSDVCFRGSVQFLTFESCRFLAVSPVFFAYRCIEIDSDALDCTFRSCFIQGRRAIQLDGSQDVRFVDCEIATFCDTLDPGIRFNNTARCILQGCTNVQTDSGAADTAATPMISMLLDGSCSETTIANCHFTGLTGSTTFVAGITMNGTTSFKAQETIISGCTFKHIYRGIYLNLAAGTAPPGSTFNISNCVVDFDAESWSECRGIYATGGPSVEVNISNCSITNGQNVDNCIGIGYQNMGSNCRLIVDGCTVEGLGTVAGTGDVFGILGDGTGGTDEGSVIVSNNHVKTLATNAEEVGAIRVIQLERAVITGNIVEDLLTITGTIRAVGTGAGATTLESYIVSDNIIRGMSAAVSGIVKAIDITGAAQVVVKGNVIHGIETGTVSGSKAMDIDNVTTACVISGNVIFAEPGSSPAGDDVEILIDCNIASLATCLIANNSLQMGDVSTRGILVGPQSSGAFFGGVTITGNAIADMNAAGAKGIEVVGPTTIAGSGPVAISGNTIQEAVYSATHGGIVITGTSGFEMDGIAITGNCIYGNNSTNARTVGYSNSAIGVLRCEYVTCTGNMVRWNVSASASGDDIIFDNCQQGTATGNVVSAHTAGGEIGMVGGNDFAIVGNSVGGGGIAGTVVGVGSLTVTATDGDPLNHLGP